ncbi:uncharacterized protein LOC100826700 isoform X2 [Brachypodium distachyon]|uniref:uncharacterized protein LOC100826700 isoform X2 n=1 Tax=Brachypodium distachyon TaxID=15368 RepID=UPI0001C711A3|nr:uncharacterized protein LOC100826700 isoform X2 [Brachypodium distachyon]|eukprot:XP_024318811.1 uncharacterized protein LOC100826700 isoform X2 [Brachypodium distachyon]
MEILVIPICLFDKVVRAMDSVCGVSPDVMPAPSPELRPSPLYAGLWRISVATVESVASSSTSLSTNRSPSRSTPANFLFTDYSECGCPECREQEEVHINRGQAYLEPMMLSMPTDCWPDPVDCYEHLFCHMMQIYSLKLAYTSADADTSGNPILLYGFMAVRDCLNPRRNYVFRRTRDDPFVVVQDSNGSSFIRMSGPKRGIEMQSLVLVEFDMRIKIGENEEDDLQLIDGAIYFDSLVLPPDMIINRRIVGDCGAVDMSLAFLHCAAEATIQVGISNVPDGGLSLFLQAHANDIKNGIWLFDNVVSEPCELNRFVVAACRGSKLLLIVKSRPVNGTASLPISKFFIRDVRRHGSDSMTFNVHTAKIDVKVNWSTLDLPSSALREDNHYPFALDD